MKSLKTRTKTMRCESCGTEDATRYQLVRGIMKEWYCWDCALAYGRKNWVNFRWANDR
jgi:ribosomal protein S26